MNDHSLLVVGGTLSFAAAILHVAIIVGGARWYRFFGAGEKMARLAEQGSSTPTITTSFIVLLLTLCGLYGLSGAGVIVRLPLLDVGLVVVTGVYLARGLLGLPAYLLSNHPYIQELGFGFWLWSSLVVTAAGAVHAIGLYCAWPHLGS